VRSRFRCLDEDDKSAALGAERLGYPGTHFEIELRPGDPEGAEFKDSDKLRSPIARYPKPI
jgi:hypothetical protein